ncbi:MAG TPA: hypothetical protein VFG31_01545 [Conexibacter sp.]|nr:hypothetical protein [Conexibacter sp.]
MTLKLDRDVVEALTTVTVRRARGASGRAKARVARGVVPASVLAVSGGNEDSSEAILVR